MSTSFYIVCCSAADVDSSSDISKASPGAYAATPVDIAVSMPAYSDRVTLDIDLLHKQYKRLKQRQKQAHIILTGLYYLKSCA